MQKAEQQGVAFARQADIAQITALKGSGLGCELADLGMRDLVEERARVEDPIELGKPLGPRAKVFQGCGPGLCFSREKPFRRSPSGTSSKASSIWRCSWLNAPVMR